MGAGSEGFDAVRKSKPQLVQNLWRGSTGSEQAGQARRSAVMGAEAIGGTAGAAGPGAETCTPPTTRAPSLCPQSWQKERCSGFAVPHVGQITSSPSETVLQAFVKRREWLHDGAHQER
jgi:hypothetical protein